MSNRLPAGLDRGSIAILRAVIAAIRPRGSGFDQPIDDEVLHAVDGFLRHVPAPLRLGLPFGLRLLEWGPIVFSRPRRATRLSRLPREEGERYLEGWLEAGGLRGTLVLGLRTLVFMAFYQHPTVLESLGVDWQGRARERIARRTELLREGA
ncbi:MAG TPA: hypothetical protein VEI94_08140 [Candidatus Bathyarchaeia archaeon]|nr:hypothetical protein [Candidatus Bathyarchaeia archaeon]